MPVVSTGSVNGSGKVAVGAASLTVNGAINKTGGVTIAAGSTLGGSGSISGAVRTRASWSG